MSKISELEKRGLIDLGVKPDDLFEAKHNLLGAFEVLFRIDKRLKNKTTNN